MTTQLTRPGPEGPTVPHPADHRPPPNRCATGEHSGDHHSGDHAAMFRRRFWVTLALSVPVVATSPMIQMWFGFRFDVPGSAWIAPVLGSIIYAWGGWPFLSGARREAAARRPGMMLLIGLAISVAFVASAGTSLGWLDDLDFWWELALLVTIMLLGHWLEMRAIGQAEGALAALAELLPDQAERLGGASGSELVSIAELRPGDLVLVRPGGRVPADGVVVEGDAELDESLVTGESKPVSKSPGDEVVAGTVATDSSVRIRVVAVGQDTALAGIQRMVADAQATRSRAQVLADRAAALLFYVAAAAGGLTLVSWLSLGEPERAVTNTVTVLVIACPHALGLAIPLVTSIATAMSARNGILVKDRLALERMRQVDTVLFDKTGTLTAGRHVVRHVLAVDDDTDAVLALAGAVEADSEHPLARAIVAEALRRGPVPQATGARSLPGRGVTATVEGAQVSVGGPALLRAFGLSVPEDLRRRSAQWAARGAAVLSVCLLYTSPSPRDRQKSRMPSSA